MAEGRVWEKLAEQHDDIQKLEKKLANWEHTAREFMEKYSTQKKVADAAIIEIEGLRQRLKELKRDVEKDQKILVKVVKDQISHVCGLHEGKPCQTCEDNRESLKGSPNLSKVFFPEEETDVGA